MIFSIITDHNPCVFPINLQGLDSYGAPKSFPALGVQDVGFRVIKDPRVWGLQEPDGITRMP